ncbi:MAG: methylmalonyl Co-A mutase-associated GTPase MeaB [Leptothrix sp. (in: b-proteobacteria)]
MIDGFDLLAEPDRTLARSLVGAPGAAQRRAMAKAITLLESARPDHRARADALLNALLPHSGRSFRLGISGVPGVGKSTFIEALGLHLIGLGHRVAVLAVDPSSTVSGGSILGDKTRMELLSVDERAYIRPSPSSGTLGGVAEKTRESMLVTEAAGFDVVIVETVGVGQSETAVHAMTDLFVLLQLPNAGDDLQAIKKGVMELADLVVINKADLDAAAATRAQAQITSAMRLLGLHDAHGRRAPAGLGAHPHAQPDPHAHLADPHAGLTVPGHPAAHDGATLWSPQVMQLSALKPRDGAGLVEFWAQVTRFRALQTASGRLAERRAQQSLAWMWERIEAGLRQRFKGQPEIRTALPALTDAVRAGQVAASVAARQLLDLFH